jgi:acyl-CoA reductase-like NAD-dependent aldehyde dehydrogenase
MTTPAVTTPVTTTSHTRRYESLLADVTDPGGREILDPATGEVVGRAPVRSVEDLDAAVGRASAAQPAWGARSDQERIDLLVRAADAIEEAAEPLAELLSREQGKPLNGPNARFEVGACAAWFRATAATQLPGEFFVPPPPNRRQTSFADAVGAPLDRQVEDQAAHLPLGIAASLASCS